MISAVIPLSFQPCVCVCGLTSEQRNVGLSRLKGAAGLTHQLLPHLLQRHHLTNRDQSHAFIHQSLHRHHRANPANSPANEKTFETSGRVTLHLLIG